MFTRALFRCGSALEGVVASWTALLFDWELEAAADVVDRVGLVLPLPLPLRESASVPDPSEGGGPEKRAARPGRSGDKGWSL